MEMTIGQVAARVGMRPSALRYYERVGLLPKARRVNGRRRYDPEILEWIAGIKLSQQAGFTVAEIKKLFFGFPRSTRPSERWEALASTKLAELDDLIHRANVMKRLLSEGIRCGCASFRECTLLPGPEDRGRRKTTARTVAGGLAGEGVHRRDKRQRTSKVGERSAG